MPSPTLPSWAWLAAVRPFDDPELEAAYLDFVHHKPWRRLATVLVSATFVAVMLCFFWTRRHALEDIAVPVALYLSLAAVLWLAAAATVLPHSACWRLIAGEAQLPPSATARQFEWVQAVLFAVQIVIERGVLANGPVAVQGGTTEHVLYCSMFPHSLLAPLPPRFLPTACVLALAAVGELCAIAATVPQYASPYETAHVAVRGLVINGIAIGLLWLWDRNRRADFLRVRDTAQRASAMASTTKVIADHVHGTRHSDDLHTESSVTEEEKAAANAMATTVAPAVVVAFAAPDAFTDQCVLQRLVRDACAACAATGEPDTLVIFPATRGCIVVLSPPSKWDTPATTVTTDAEPTHVLQCADAESNRLRASLAAIGTTRGPLEGALAVAAVIAESVCRRFDDVLSESTAASDDGASTSVLSDSTAAVLACAIDVGTVEIARAGGYGKTGIKVATGDPIGEAIVTAAAISESGQTFTAVLADAAAHMRGDFELQPLAIPSLQQRTGSTAERAGTSDEDADRVFFVHAVRAKDIQQCLAAEAAVEPKPFTEEAASDNGSVAVTADAANAFGVAPKYRFRVPWGLLFDDPEVEEEFRRSEAHDTSRRAGAAFVVFVLCATPLSLAAHVGAPSGQGVACIVVMLALALVAAVLSLHPSPPPTILHTIVAWIALACVLPLVRLWGAPVPARITYLAGADQSIVTSIHATVCVPSGVPWVLPLIIDVLTNSQGSVLAEETREMPAYSIVAIVAIAVPGMLCVVNGHRARLRSQFASLVAARGSFERWAAMRADVERRLRLAVWPPVAKAMLHAVESGQPLPVPDSQNFWVLDVAIDTSTCAAAVRSVALELADVLLTADGAVQVLPGRIVALMSAKLDEEPVPECLLQAAEIALRSGAEHVGLPALRSDIAAALDPVTGRFVFAGL